MKEKFRAAAAGDTLTLWCYDEIGPAYLGMISAETIALELSKFKGSTINVRINSPGGDVFEANAIYNLLQGHGAHIVVDVDGLAASAASIVMLAGNWIRMAQNSMCMVHNAWALTQGNSRELRKTADILDKADSTLVDMYAARTGIPKFTIRQLMADETWMTANEAVTKGFADEIGQGLATAMARVQAGRYKRTPAACVDNRQSHPSVIAAREAVERIRRECGLPESREQRVADLVKLAAEYRSNA